jgi:uncharacterized protein YneF (UPF0154 family)
MTIEEKKIWYSPNINSIQQGANEQLDMSYKSFQAHAKTIRDELEKILNSSDNEKTKIKECTHCIKKFLKLIFGTIFNPKYFNHSTIQFFQKFDEKKIFTFLIDNLRVYQRKQNCQLHQALEETQKMSQTQTAYQQALTQSFTDSCKRFVIINKKKINISPRQAKSILYKLDKWIEDHQGFIGYQKAGQGLELSPQHTYQTISAMMKAAGQNKGLEKILKWNQFQSSDWTKIKGLFNTLNDETSRDPWIQNYQGFIGYQKAGQELGLGPQDTYQTISTMMKAVGEDEGLAKILKWNQFSSSDWTKINELFNTLNDKTSRDEWIQNYQGFKGYQKAGKKLELSPQHTYQTINAMMKAVGEDEGLAKILKWNQFSSSDWTKINNLFETLNNQKSREKWIQDHQCFIGYQKAGRELGLSPRDTYQTISTMMKAVGKDEGLEKILKWNQISFSDWEKINNLFKTLNNQKSRNKWIQNHQGFTGYREAGKELGLSPNDTYQTISAMMKAVGEDEGLEKILKWKQISSSDWKKINNLFDILNDQKPRDKWIQDHQGFIGYQKAGKELGLCPQHTYQTISAMMKAVGKDERLEKILKWNQFQSSDWTKINDLFNILKHQKSRNKWIQNHQGFKGYREAAKELGLSPQSSYQTISAIMKAVGQKSGLEKLLKWNHIKSSSWEKIISIHRSLGETQLDDELKQSLLLLFSRSKDQLNRIITFIESYNETLEKLKGIIEIEATTPDFNSVLQQLNISSDMLRALFLSYNSYKLKTFANKVLGDAYQVLPTQDSDQELGLSSTLESRTDSSSLQRASELIEFLLDHKDLEQGIKDLINQYLIEGDEKSIAQIVTLIPKEIIQEFSEMNMGM